MLLSAVSVLVVAQSSSEIPVGLTNNPVYIRKSQNIKNIHTHIKIRLIGVLKRILVMIVNSIQFQKQKINRFK